MRRVLVSSAYRKSLRFLTNFLCHLYIIRKEWAQEYYLVGHHILFASYQTKCHLFLLFGVYLPGMIQTSPLLVLLYHSFLVCLIRFGGLRSQRAWQSRVTTI